MKKADWKEVQKGISVKVARADVWAKKKRRLAVVQDLWNLMFQVGAPSDGTDAAAFRLPS